MKRKNGGREGSKWKNKRNSEETNWGNKKRERIVKRDILLKYKKGNASI